MKLWKNRKKKSTMSLKSSMLQTWTDIKKLLYRDLPQLTYICAYVVNIFSLKRE